MVKCLALLAILFTLPALFFRATAQAPIALSYRAPVHCSGLANNCVYPFVFPNSTGMIVARQSGAGTLTDNLGDVWHRDQCNPFDNDDCIFSTHFNVPWLSGPVTVTFPAGEGNDVYLLIYNGIWNFDSGQQGNYDTQNSAFSDCTNGGACPYNWTLPVDADAGDLLVSWSNENGSGHLVPSPGFGFSIEGFSNASNFAVEDMIAPVRGVYIGSLEWMNPDGSINGGGHWLMGIAEYKRQH